MPERLKAILDKITAWWKKFNTKQRSVLISIVAVVIVALVILGVVISRPTQVELVEAQSASEASTIKGVLEDNNISYEVDSKLVFFVNKSDEVNAIMALGDNGIPASTNEAAFLHILYIIDNRCIWCVLAEQTGFGGGTFGSQRPHILYSLIHMGVHHECQTQTILFLIEHSQMMTAKTKLVSHGTVVVLHVAWPHRIFNCISFKILLHLAHRAFAAAVKCIVYWYSVYLFSHRSSCL